MPALSLERSRAVHLRPLHMKIRIPRVCRIRWQSAFGSIRQLARPEEAIEGSLANYQSSGVRGKLLLPTDPRTEQILIVEKRQKGTTDIARVIVAPQAALSAHSDEYDLRRCDWAAHPEADTSSATPLPSRATNANLWQAATNSWAGAFAYVAGDEELGIEGLRPPQIGALHAIQAYWTTSEEPATIVMPTGTGKTDTMIAALVATPIPRVLVIVPSDALRTQLAEKFLTLGILRSIVGMLAQSAQFPIVGTLLKKPTTVAEVDSFFERCHVIVTTSHIAAKCKEKLQARIAHHCPYLFIDEAHHAEAPTWQAFREHFTGRRVVQFTATPFREDGKALDGKIIYKYPLRKAQQEGYFKTIQFDAVQEFDLAKADRAIAARAVHHLRNDASGKHIVMARVGSVSRAQAIFKLYEQHPEFHPVQLHTGIGARSARDHARESIISGRSRIVVCVDMLGEGFDLPELKIAAFHDIRKSLAVTLQLAGRFTRSRPDLGNAVFIANTADVTVCDELRKLYTRDPDWNLLLPEFSDAAIEEQVTLKEFLEGFASFTDDIPLQRIRPATSAVIYKTRCSDWSPDNFRAGIPGLYNFERIHSDINHARHTLVVVTARKEPVAWAHNDQVYDWVWDLLVVFWDQQQKLLFINSSSNEGVFKSLARAVAGAEVELINESAVFRTFDGINRLTLQNVGLTEQLGRLIRYTGRMGPDIEPGLSEAHKRNTRRTVVSGKGFESGARVTVGASRKGRIWSMRRANLENLIRWFKHVGRKVLDENIDPAQVLQGTLECTVVAQMPAAPPMAVDWPELVYADKETAIDFLIDGTQTWALSDCELRLNDDEDEESEEVSFALVSDHGRVMMSLRIFETNDVKNYRFTIEPNRSVMVTIGASQMSLQEFFYEEPPMIWFTNGASLEGNTYTPLKATYPPYPRDKIVAWDWKGIDLTEESQGEERNIHSIQYRVIETLKKDDYAVIFDDDGSGEAADVVALRIDARRGSRSIDVEFYHCKYSRPTPGKRIKDLYEVCGQAQKSVHWMSSEEKRTEIFTHLLRRESKRQAKGGTTRFDRGDATMLTEVREKSRTWPVRLKVFTVQPGVSRASASDQQLELLSVTENYLLETHQLAFQMIASK